VMPRGRRWVVAVGLAILVARTLDHDRAVGAELGADIRALASRTAPAGDSGQSSHLPDGSNQGSNCSIRAIEERRSPPTSSAMAANQKLLPITPDAAPGARTR